MRILLLTETLVVGGAETFVVRLANALAPDHEVTLGVMHGERTNRALLDMVDPKVRVEQCRLPAKRLLQTADGLTRRLSIDHSLIPQAHRRWLVRLIDQIRPDIAHSHLFKPDLLVTRTRAALPAMRHVVTMHGDYAPFLTGESDPQMLAIGQRLSEVVVASDAFVAVCAEQRRFLIDRFPIANEKTKLIYNGYRPWRAAAAARVREPARIRFVMASRGVKKKGWAKAIAAFAQLAPAAAELVLVGEGEHLDELAAGPIPPGVEFVGFSDNPIDHIAQADVGLLPSEFPNESLPTVVMEYLYCGKPVIATDVGEIAAMIESPNVGLAGKLLPFLDGSIKVEDLAAAMHAYVDNPALRRCHAALAPAAFAKFDMGVCAAAYARVYAEVAARVSSNSSIKASH